MMISMVNYKLRSFCRQQGFYMAMIVLVDLALPVITSLIVREPIRWTGFLFLGPFVIFRPLIMTAWAFWTVHESLNLTSQFGITRKKDYLATVLALLVMAVIFTLLPWLLALIPPIGAAINLEQLAPLRELLELFLFGGLGLLGGYFIKAVPKFISVPILVLIAAALWHQIFTFVILSDELEVAFNFAILVGLGPIALLVAIAVIFGLAKWVSRFSQTAK